METENWIIQERWSLTPWHMFVCCLLLNQTSNRQVKPLLKKFFTRYPSPENLVSADMEELKELIRPLGFYNRRAQTLIRFSKEYLGEWKDPRELYGIGKYAWDSYRIFILGDFEIETEDKVLRAYLEKKNKSKNSKEYTV